MQFFRSLRWSCAAALTLMVSAVVAGDAAPRISGDYLEARTCDVYTGPCFANGEIGLTGHEAVMAWKVDEGAWAGRDLKGLCVALVVKANDTLGFGGTFTSNPDVIKSVLLTDAKATPEQAAALVQFVKDQAPSLTREIQKVQSAPLSLTNDFVSGKGKFTAGTVAKIETRGLKGSDCVCSNESVIYPPLSKVENVKAAYTVDMTYAGTGLNSQWSTINKRSAFLATFAR
jgi:hypothetical protein